jgi:hypothetical protein
MKRLSLRICYGVWLVLLHPLLVAWLGAGACFAGDVALDEILLQMSEDGSKLNSEPLHNYGLGGLSMLLDKLFPRTAKQPDHSLSEDEVTRLIRQLGAEDFGDREHATRRIGDEAEVFRGLVEQASQDPDPEIRARVRSILGGWDARAESFLKGDVGKYADAFCV